MGDTSIEWTRGDDGSLGKTWNPIRGCARVSEGCRHCYAESVAARFSGEGQPYHGVARRRSNGEATWTGMIRVVPEHIEDPLRWTKPRRVFVNSMSDLFHEGVGDSTLALIFGVMALAPRHTFQILTKRPERMQDVLADGGRAMIQAGMERVGVVNRRGKAFDVEYADLPFPLPNVWLGVSVEHQSAAEARIPYLLNTPAAVRFLSCEPLLGPVDLTDIYVRHSIEGMMGGGRLDALRGQVCDRETGCVVEDVEPLDWVIVGGESGRDARPMDLRWAASLVAACTTASVPAFVKQLGAVPMEPESDWRGRAKARLLDARNRERVPEGFVPLKIGGCKGDDIATWPQELQMREMPEVRE